MQLIIHKLNKSFLLLDIYNKKIKFKKKNYKVKDKN